MDKTGNKVETSDFLKVLLTLEDKTMKDLKVSGLYKVVEIQEDYILATSITTSTKIQCISAQDFDVQLNDIVLVTFTDTDFRVNLKQIKQNNSYKDTDSKSLHSVNYGIITRLVYRKNYQPVTPSEIKLYDTIGQNTDGSMTQKATTNELATLQASINNKQDKLTFDSKPTVGSTNPVTSDGINTAINDVISSLKRHNIYMISSNYRVTCTIINTRSTVYDINSFMTYLQSRGLTGLSSSSIDGPMLQVSGGSRNNFGTVMGLAINDGSLYAIITNNVGTNLINFTPTTFQDKVTEL